MEINLLAVAVATVGALIAGALYYSPWTFGPLWKKLAGLKDKDMKNAAYSYVVGFLTMAVTVTVVAYLMSALKVDNYVDALIFAVVLWAGFSFAVKIGTVVWEKRGFNLFILNSAFDLLYYMVITTLLLYFS